MVAHLPLLVGLTLLAIAIAVGSVVIGHGIRDRNKNDVITVTASAKKRVFPAASSAGSRSHARSPRARAFERLQLSGVS